MSWRLAKSLATLRSQVDAAYPGRKKQSDGTIGDAAHAKTKSDHNPNAAGVVRALDLTHDPQGGFDSYAFAERLRGARDPRLKYVISNGRIFTSGDWRWRGYRGANKHDKHVHISVADDPKLYDGQAAWAGVVAAESASAPAPAPGTSKVPAAIVAAAQASQRTWDIPASVVIAQWALESGWGKSMPKGSNNPFGIKALPGQASVSAPTREVINGKSVHLEQRFAKYPSLTAAFEAHGKLLATSGHYAAARQVRNDPEAFAHALTGIYATDPNYGAALVKIMRQHGLAAYDVAADLAVSSAKAPAPPYLVKAIQQQLLDLRYGMVAKVDGVIGPRTIAGITAFQSVNGLPTTGELDAATIAALGAKPKPMPIPAERKDASAKDLAPESPIVRKAEKAETVAGAGAAVPAVGGLLYYAGQALDALKPIREFIEGVPGWAWLILLVAGAGVLFWQARQIKAARVAMHRVGETA